MRERETKKETKRENEKKRKRERGKERKRESGNEGKREREKERREKETKKREKKTKMIKTQNATKKKLSPKIIIKKDFFAYILESIKQILLHYIINI